jgi:hypothetical protein
MKTLLITIFLIFSLYSCSTYKPNPKYQIVEIEGCEYIEYYFDNGDVKLIHKENCRNPKHKRNLFYNQKYEKSI